MALVSREGYTRKQTSGIIARSMSSKTVYVDPMDWVDVMSGKKRELRVYSPPGFRRQGWLRPPRPCVFYNLTDTVVQTALGMIEALWNEPLGAITQESLEAEGFEDLDAFRRYINVRFPNMGYRPLSTVVVRRIHPMTDEEEAYWMRHHWEHLYGQFR